MVKIERSFPAPASLEKESRKKSGAVIPGRMWFSALGRISTTNAISVR